MTVLHKAFYSPIDIAEMLGRWTKMRSCGSMTTTMTMMERLWRRAEWRMTFPTATASTWKPKKVSCSGITELFETFSFLLQKCLIFTVSVTAGAANGANGANNNGKAAAIPPASPAVTPNNSSSSSVKTVALPATPVVKVMHLEIQLFINAPVISYFLAHITAIVEL